MLLTITTTHRPATDLGYLLRQAPRPGAVVRRHRRHGARLLPGGDRGALHRRAAAGGRPGRRPAAKRRRTRSRCGQYVNDRPYAASSLLSAALRQGACAPRCAATRRDRPELAADADPARAAHPGAALPGGRRWPRVSSSRSAGRVEADPDPARPDASRVGRQPLRRPDAARHAAARGRAQPPLRAAAGPRRRASTTGSPPTRSTSCCGAGDGWLAEHPEKALIARRYLAHQRGADQRGRWPGCPRWTTTGRRTADEDAELPLAGQRVAAGRAAPRRGRRSAGRGRRQPRARPRLRRRARCSPRCSRDRRFTEIVGVDVSTRVAGDGGPPAAAGPAARAAARPDPAAAVRADLPRRPAARASTRPC